MSTDIADRLRELAHEHYEGRLDLAAYRALRGPLLDSLASGTSAPAMEITQPRVSHRQMQRDAITRPGKPHIALPADEPRAAPRKNSPVLAVCIAGVIVALLAGAAWIWFQRGHAGAEPNTSTTSVPSGAARSAVEGFMDAADWSDGRVTGLNATLMELGGEQIAPLAREAGFQRFVDELRRRLKEQQALSPTALTVDNSPLAALAVTVGLDLNSPDSALHISAAAPTHEPESVTPALPIEPKVTRPAMAPPPSATAVSEPEGKSPVPVASKNEITATESPISPLVASNTTDNCRRDLIHSRRPVCQDGDGPMLALVPAGAFDMGSTEAPEEQPVHHVTIAEPFAISIYEVSQGEFKQYCDATHRPCSTQPWPGDDYPVVNVSWDDANSYVEWLSATTHHHYNLPTEAQWEYAARAGNTGLYPSGTTLSPTDANFSMLKKQTAAARRSQKFNANAFRLVHTVGNVREWVADPWSQTYAGAPSDGTTLKSAKPAMRVARGGSYTDGSARLRLSMREGLAPDTRDVTTGFRIVRELQ